VEAEPRVADFAIVVTAVDVGFGVVSDLVFETPQDVRGTQEIHQITSDLVGPVGARDAAVVARVHNEAETAAQEAQSNGPEVRALPANLVGSVQHQEAGQDGFDGG
jgi:hypothetical protein